MAGETAKERRVRRACCGFAALLHLTLLLGGGAAWAAGEALSWWNRAWPYRKLVRVKADGPAVCRLWLHTGKRARPDGRDIRVVDSRGNLVPCGVVYSDGDRHLLVFRRSGKRETGPYAIYFGNPSVPVAFPMSVPGLVLETRAIPEEADVSSWEAAKETLRRATTRYGKDFWTHVFDAYNPFGPQGNYISLHRGELVCPREGTYGFATVSDDASFLFVDGELIAEWPGRGHNINKGRWGRYSGEVKLRAGRHKFEYVGFAFDKPKRMVAAWKPPGAKRWTVIPPEAFTQVARVRPYRCEVLGRPLCADFRAEPLAYLEVGEAQLVAVQFVSLSTSGKGPIQALRWDFGDGQTSQAKGPVHVYLRPGRYAVSLRATSADGLTDAFGISLDVQPIRHDLDFRRPKKEKFIRWSEDLSIPRLSVEQLLALRALLKEAPPGRRLFETCLELNKRRDRLTPDQSCQVALDLADYYLDPLDNWKAAEKFLRQALEACPEAERRLDIRFRLADLYLDRKKDPDAAERAYRALREECGSKHPRRARLALIGLGDVERRRGRREAARRLYAEAEADPAFRLKEPAPVADGHFMEEVEWHLSQKDGQAALDVLDRWLWRLPTRRLDGRATVLRLEALLLLKRYREMKEAADLYIGFADEPNHLPRVHLLAGWACWNLGQKEEARRYWQTVLDRWPESPSTEGARRALAKR